MKNKILSVFVFGFFLLNAILPAQEEIRIRIRDGLPFIPVALPEIAFTDQSEIDQEIRNTLHETLWQDLDYSRVFRMIPKEHYQYIPRLTGDQVNFKDWASLQARFLLTGQLEITAGDRIIFSFKIYDVQSERFVFGKNYGGRKDLIRLIAHRTADELMKLVGEKPVFASRIAFVSERDGNKEIYVMDYDGHRQTRLTNNTVVDMLPSWSTDNSKIAYTSYRRMNPDLYLLDIYSGQSEMIATGGTNYAADFSPDGNHLVYTSTRDGNAEIYVKELAGGRDRRLTFNQAIDTAPNWSPSGREIVFVSDRSGSPQIYIMDAEGANVRRISYQGTYHDSPAWSPDGSRIAFVGRVEGRFDIFVHILRSSETIKLTENSGRNENPSWSPDGRHLAFSSTRGGSSQVWLMDYDGSNARQITFQGENKMAKWQKSVQ